MIFLPNDHISTPFVYLKSNGIRKEDEKNDVEITSTRPEEFPALDTIASLNEINSIGVPRVSSTYQRIRSERDVEYLPPCDATNERDQSHKSSLDIVD